MFVDEFQRRTFVCTWTETSNPSQAARRSVERLSAAPHYSPLARYRSEPPFTRGTDRSPLGIARGRRCTKVVSDVTPRCCSIELTLVLFSTCCCGKEVSKWPCVITGMATTVRAGRQRNCGSIPARARDLSLLQSVQTGGGGQPASDLYTRG
jgi:hypothetical protein